MDASLGRLASTRGKLVDLEDSILREGGSGGAGAESETTTVMGCRGTGAPGSGGSQTHQVQPLAADKTQRQREDGW